MAASKEAKNWLTIREKVTLDWTLPTEEDSKVKKAGVREFPLLHGEISAYNVSVCNANSRRLAVSLSSSEACLLLRPARFIIKGGEGVNAQTSFFTVAFAPVAFHPAKDQEFFLEMHTYLLPEGCQDFIDLDALFETGTTLPYKNASDHSLIHLPYRLRKPSGKAVLQDGLVAIPLRFRYTFPGHLTAYFFLHFSNSTSPTTKHCIAWRLSPVDSLWYTVKDGLPDYIATSCGVLFTGHGPARQMTFSYLDFKGHPTLLSSGHFSEAKQSFRLQILEPPWTLQDTLDKDFNSCLIDKVFERMHSRVHTMEIEYSFEFGEPDSASGFYQVELPPKEYQFTFKAPYNALQSATISTENPSQSKLMISTVIPQEASLFDFRQEGVAEEAVNVNFIPYLMGPKTNDKYTLKLKDLVAYFIENPARRPVNRQQLFRMNTFLTPKPDKALDELFCHQEMNRSIDRRELRCTFIRCTFEDEDALKAAEKGQVYQMPDKGKPVIAESIGTDSQIQENLQPGLSPSQPSALLSPSANQASTSPPIGQFTESQDNHSPGVASAKTVPGSAQMQTKTVGGRTKRSRSPAEKLSSPPNTSQLKAQQSTQQGRPKKRTPKSPGKARQRKGGSVQPQGNSVLPGSPHFRAYRQTVYQRRSPLGPGSPRDAHLRLTVPTKEDMELLFGIVVCLAVSLLLQDAFIKTLT